MAYRIEGQPKRPFLKELYVRTFRYYQYQTEQKLARYANAPTHFPPELVNPFGTVERSTNEMTIEQDGIKIKFGLNHGVRPADSVKGFVDRYNETYPDHPIDSTTPFSQITNLSINGGGNIIPQYYSPVFVRELPDVYRGGSAWREIVVLGNLNVPLTFLALLHEIGHAKKGSTGDPGDTLVQLRNPNSRVYYDQALAFLESEENAWKFAREQLEPIFKNNNAVFTSNLFEQVVNWAMGSYANLVQQKINSGHMDYRNRRY